MLEVHIYGDLIQKIDPTRRINESLTKKVKYSKNQTLNSLLKTLDLSKADIGDCFVNFRYRDCVRDGNIKIPNESRVALFSKGMSHIDFMANRVYGKEKWG